MVETSSLDVTWNQFWLRVFNRPSTSTEHEDASEFHAYLDATLVTEDNATRESLCWQELCHSPLASNEFLFRI
jgi:hypothetical protein